MKLSLIPIILVEVRLGICTASTAEQRQEDPFGDLLASQSSFRVSETLSGGKKDGEQLRKTTGIKLWPPHAPEHTHMFLTRRERGLYM